MGHLTSSMRHWRSAEYWTKGAIAVNLDEDLIVQPIHLVLPVCEPQKVDHGNTCLLPKKVSGVDQDLEHHSGVRVRNGRERSHLH